MRPRRPIARSAVAGPLAVAAVTVLLAGPGVASSSAATHHAPCPTGGTTIYRSSRYEQLGLRVYRVGKELRSCVRQAGKARHVRVLGPWSPATKVAVGGGILTWTTRTTASDGTAADTIRGVYEATGKRTFTVSNAAVATSATTPASTDTVISLRTDGIATAWVTSRGRLAVHVAVSSLVPDDDGGVFHDGPLYALRDVGPAQAPALAKGLAYVDDSQTDDCGGTIEYRLTSPAVEGSPAGSFIYYQDEAEPSSDCT